MHYVLGHEVATYITKEVDNLAQSNSIPWETIREDSNGSSYCCQAGDIIAVKIIEYVDCSPEVLCYTVNVVLTDFLGQAQTTVLDEYDSNNQIIIGTIQFSGLPKLAKCCVYRNMSVEPDTQRHFIVYQSIDHEALPESDDYILFKYAPTGFLITPIPDNPNKCKLIYVSQLSNLEQYTSTEFIQSYLATAGGLGRMFQDISRAVPKSNVNNSSLSPQILNQVESMRQEGYSNFYELNETNGWKMIEHSWYDAYSREDAEGNLSIAVRSTFYSPETCEQTAARIYDALRHSGDWNWLVFKSDVEVLDEGTCIVDQLSQGFEPGSYTELEFLLACRANIDGSCDITWKAVNCNSSSTNPEAIRLKFQANACVVTPNGHGSSVLWLSRPPPVRPDAFKVPIGRAINILTGVKKYIVKNTSDITIPLAAGSESTPMLGSLQARSREPESNKRKRDLSTSLSITHVENIVSKGNSGKQPRPFLFLVSNSAEGRRFVRRKCSESYLELLPNELLEHIMSFLDCTALASFIPRVCSRLKEFLEDSAMWKRWYGSKWGPISGRLSLRYCGDDDPSSVFTTSFSYWKEAFCEKYRIETAWEHPEHKVHGFRVVSGHTRAIRTINLSPTCHRITTGSLDKLIRVWDAHSGSCIVSIPGASGVVAVTVGYMSLTAGYKSGMVRYFEPTKEVNVREVRLSESMRGCLFMKHGIATWDEDVEMWDEITHQKTHTFNGHTGYISECITGDSVLYSGSRDKTIKLWDTKAGSRIATITGHTRGVNGITLISDYLCASVSADRTLRVWDKRKLELPLVVQTYAAKIRCVKSSAVGNKICIGGKEGVRVLRSDTFEQIMWDQSESVESIAMDEERLAYGAVGGIVRFYDFAPHN